MKLRSLLNEDLIPGGKGDKMSVKDIAKKHDLPVDFIQKQLDVGIIIEREHTGQRDDLASEVSRDHLTENGFYYIKLIKSGIVDEKEAIDLYNKTLKDYPLPYNNKNEGKINMKRSELERLIENTVKRVLKENVDISVLEKHVVDLNNKKEGLMKSFVHDFKGEKDRDKKMKLRDRHIDIIKNLDRELATANEKYKEAVKLMKSEE
jgi:hypothetical protein